MQQVHLRINDAATGQPTPVRMRITDSDGTYYAPFGRLTEFATGVNQDVGGNVQIGAKKWAYIDGACEILLPPGQLHVEISKGPEYKPIDEEITLLAGKMSLRFTIERWCDLRKEGWYSGDTRVHFLSPDAALLEGQAEDVAVVNLLAVETDNRSIPNILSFSGQSFARQSATCGVAVNTFNDLSYQGCLALLHSHRIVFPLSWRSVDGDAEWTLADWCDQCHRKNGLAIWAYPRGALTADFQYGEPLADLVLKKIDAFEISPADSTPHSALSDYYLLCDASLIVPLVGASVKRGNDLQLGAMRTYAHLSPGQDFTYSNWVEAVRSGRTFISNGPFVQITIDGAVPGSNLVVPSGKETLEISVHAKSAVPFDHLQLLWNGEIIASSAHAGRFPHHVEIYHELPLQSSGWLAARCVTDRTHGASRLPLAHTSAIAVQIDGEPPRAKPDAASQLLHELDGMLRFAKTTQRRTRLAHVVEEARTTLAKKLS